ncbi:MAG TPA: hypothetical protein VJL80_07375 [Aeromicrobium sp.]|nr:hypothetical protein [Aeromicrobium sp.]HKY57842.1 hypothetical protein [Aeromicrobium sp.]
MDEQVSRDIDLIDRFGRFGWSDREGEGRTRNILFRLLWDNLVDRDALIAEMVNRGHGPAAVGRLKRFIVKTDRHIEAERRRKTTRE